MLYMEGKVPDVAFLGVCDRISHIQDGDSIFWHHNIIGLRKIVPFYIFPLSLKGMHFAFAVYDYLNYKPARIRIVSLAGNVVADMLLSINISGYIDPTVYSPHWDFVTLTIKNDPPIIKEPEIFKIILTREGCDIPLGELKFDLAKVEPLTEDRIAAIKSSAVGAKAVRISIECKKCNDSIKVYTGIMRRIETENEGYLWYREIPELFVCRCEATRYNLTYLKNNMHSLLGKILNDNDDLVFTPLYEIETLKIIIDDFAKLLNKNPKEEIVQTYIENNTILLHFFSPERIYFKSPILSKFVTDVVILNGKKELLLIELEKPEIPLLKKGGGLSSLLQHAIDQLKDWQFIINDHRLSVLECIGLNKDEVGKIRLIVIAGRNRHNPEHLRKLKATINDVELFTYDDVLKNAKLLLQSFGNL